jgi:hypothetical protein
MFESSRVQLDKIMKKYREYLDLYCYFNEGSSEGATTFQEFYWRYTYYSRYKDQDQPTSMG